jgi:hypothetical protein
MYNGYSICGVTNALVDTNFLQSFPDMGTSMIVRCGSNTVSFTTNTAPLITNYTEPNGQANVNFKESGTIPIGVAAQGDNTAYLAWIAAHQGGTPPTPIPPDYIGIIAQLKAQNTALQAQVDADTKYFSTIGAAVNAARPPTPTPISK